MSKELVVVEGQESPNHLVALALEKQADPETMAKLLALQERWEASQARKAYVIAMTAFKREAPSVLKKSDRVDFTSARGRTSYNYANLGSIVQEITATMSKHDLSASWETSQDDKGNVTVICHITHSAGHRESVALSAPPDESGNKNKIQSVGSTVTYLQRYTLLAALGLATGEDDDGRGGAPKEPIQEPRQTQSPEEEAVFTICTGINAVSHKPTKKGGKYYTIVGKDGEEFHTFDDKKADVAQNAHDAGVPVEMKYTVDDQYGIKIQEIIMLEPGSNG